MRAAVGMIALLAVAVAVLWMSAGSAAPVGKAVGSGIESPRRPASTLAGETSPSPKAATVAAVTSAREELPASSSARAIITPHGDRVPWFASVEIVDDLGVAVDDAVVVDPPVEGQRGVVPRRRGHGRFDLFIERDADGIDVDVWTPEAPTLATHHRVPRGANGLRLVHPRFGRILASVRCDPSLTNLDVWLEVAPSEPHFQRFHGSGRQPGPLSFDSPPLAPGRYTVAVYVPTRKEPLLTIADVEVRPGEVCRDPRLFDIDLGAQAWRAALTLQRSDGRPIGPTDLLELEAEVRDASGTLVGMQTIRSGTSMKVYGRGAFVDVTLRSQTFRTVTITGVRHDRVVLLQPKPVVRVRVSGARLSRGDRIDVALVDGSGAEAARVTATVGWAARLVVDAPGAYGVRACGADETTLEVVPSRLDVLDADEQEFAVDVR